MQHKLLAMARYRLLRDKPLDRIRIIRIIKIALKHGVVSVICGSTEIFLLYFLSVRYAVDISLAYFISFVFATFLGFVLHIFFTFKVCLSFRSFALFASQIAATLMLGYFIFTILMSVSNSLILSKLIQLVVTFTVNLYVGRYYTFVNKG